MKNYLIYVLLLYFINFCVLFGFVFLVIALIKYSYTYNLI